MPSTVSTATKEQISIDQSNEVWIVSNTGAVIVSNQVAIYEADTFKNSRIVVEGHVSTSEMQTAVLLNGVKTSLTIGDEGSLAGGNGLASFGAMVSVVNRGQIYGDTTGLELHGSNGRLDNYGLITGGGGGVFLLAQETMVNHKGAIVRATGVAVYANVAQDIHFINDGKIEVVGNVMGSAVYLGSGDDTVVNHGTVIGALRLGDGNNTLDGTGGRIEGSLETGNGNNVLNLQNSTIVGSALGNQGTLYLGDGNDRIDLSHARVSGSIAAAGGNDTIDVRAARIGGSIQGSGGNDTLIVSNENISWRKTMAVERTRLGPPSPMSSTISSKGFSCSATRISTPPATVATTR